MKSLAEIIQILRECNGPSRHVDFQIAQHLGWKENSNRVSRSGDSKTVWLNPETAQPGKVPAFTKELQHSFRLLQYICPEYAGAAIRKGKTAIVQVEHYEPSEATTLPLAMCQAALLVLADRSSQNLHATGSNSSNSAGDVW